MSVTIAETFELLFDKNNNILKTSFPLNVLGYLVIALVWSVGERLFYVVLADKINAIRKPKKIFFVIWNAL